MHMPQCKNWWRILLTCGFLCFITACGSAPSAIQPSLDSSSTVTVAPTSSTASVKTSGSAGNTSKNDDAMPSTQTTCPTQGTARAMVTAPLVMGTHPSIVYSVNKATSDTSASSTLMRYDRQTGLKTKIIQLVNTTVFQTQISNDSQWILFAATSKADPIKLQVIRIDGQGLQTLYCTNSNIEQIRWSVDQKYIAFSMIGNLSASVHLLQTSTGLLQAELIGGGVTIRSWLDNTHLYLTNQIADSLPTKIYLLDITRGPNQQLADLTPVFQGPICAFDISNDHSYLFIDQSKSQASCSPPNLLTIMPATGGTPQVIFNSQHHDITDIHTINQQKLLLTIDNSAQMTSAPTDESQNGLWLLDVGSTGLTQLITKGPQQLFILDHPDISRDGSMYTLQIDDFHVANGRYTLQYGNISGGPPTTFASSADRTSLDIVGWITI